MAAPQVSGRALLLRRTPFGNSSLVVHVLTGAGRRIELIAKGAYRPRSRYAGVLDWFDTLLLAWTPPRPGGGDLGTLRTGEIEVRRRRLTQHIGTYRAAQTAVELTDLATRAGAGDPELFRLLEQCLTALDDPRVPDIDPEARTNLRLAAFELQLLGALGLAPSLELCAVCGAEAPAVVDVGTSEPRAAFSAAAGGRLCAKHGNEAHAGGMRVGTLPVRVLAAAAGLATRPLASIEAPAAVAAGERSPCDRRDNPTDAGGASSDPSRILDFTGRFLDHHLEARPRSHARFLSAPDRNRRTLRTAQP